MNVATQVILVLTVEFISMIITLVMQGKPAHVIDFPVGPIISTLAVPAVTLYVVSFVSLIYT